MKRSVTHSGYEKHFHNSPKALRLVLNTLSTSAARYGRYIQPLLSLSIDFYVRLFVRVRSAPIEVKKAFRYFHSHYNCSGFY